MSFCPILTFQFWIGFPLLHYLPLGQCNPSVHGYDTKPPASCLYCVILTPEDFMWVLAETSEEVSTGQQTCLF